MVTTKPNPPKGEDGKPREIRLTLVATLFPCYAISFIADDNGEKRRSKMPLLKSTLIMLAVLTLAACDCCTPPPDTTPLDHFKCYVAEGEVPEIEVLRLEDQFHIEKDVQLVELRYFCNPVTKFINDEPREAAPDEDHLTCYMIEPQEPFQTTVTAHNQFGETELKTLNSELLCVPTHKHDFDPAPVGHCPGGLDCCCGVQSGGDWPGCTEPGTECRQQTTSPFVATCAPTAQPLRPIQLYPTEPPFCRIP